MLIVNGVNVFPSQIEEALMKDAGSRHQLSDSGGKAGSAGSAGGQDRALTPSIVYWR
jgi:hypothetical protein